MPSRGVVAFLGLTGTVGVEVGVAECAPFGKVATEFVVEVDVGVLGVFGVVVIRAGVGVVGVIIVGVFGVRVVVGWAGVGDFAKISANGSAGTFVVAGLGLAAVVGEAVCGGVIGLLFGVIFPRVGTGLVGVDLAGEGLAVPLGGCGGGRDGSEAGERVEEDVGATKGVYGRLTGDVAPPGRAARLCVVVVAGITIDGTMVRGDREEVAAAGVDAGAGAGAGAGVVVGVTDCMAGVVAGAEGRWTPLVWGESMKSGWRILSIPFGVVGVSRGVVGASLRGVAGASLRGVRGVDCTALRRSCTSLFSR